MLWRRKQAKDGTAGGGEVLRPAALTIELDSGVFNSKLDEMLRAMEEQAGVAEFIGSLQTKHALFERALAQDSLGSLDQASLDALLETVFPARKRLPVALARLELTALRELLERLVYGDGHVKARLNAFVDAVPVPPAQDKAGQKVNAKIRRSAWDFGAELLHFRSPEQYPLMTKWVWDLGTQSGAMREFIKGNDTLREVPYDDRPETFEAVRVWVGERLSERGFYRDVPFLVDLVFAWAYTDYMRAMSSSMGLLEAEFGGKQDPAEPVKKLLGIDPARRGGQSRVKRDTVH